jgi:hypothetical protein
METLLLIGCSLAFGFVLWCIFSANDRQKPHQNYPPGTPPIDSKYHILLGNENAEPPQPHPTAPPTQFSDPPKTQRDSFGKRKTKNGRWRKTRNDHIDDGLEFILLEPRETLRFNYTNQKGETKRHECDTIFITGTEDEAAVYLVASPFDTDRRFSFYLDKMQKVYSQNQRRTFTDGHAWLQTLIA